MEKKKIIRNVLLLSVLFAFALWFALHKDFDAVMALLANMNGWYASLVILMGLLYYVLAGVNITWIARRYQPSYSHKEGITCAYSCALFNGITPLGCGQVSQSYVLRKQNVKLKDGLSVLWLDFIIFQSILLVYVGIVLLWKLFYYYEVYSNWFLLVFAGFLVNSFVIAFLYTFAFFPRIYNIVFRKIVMFVHRLHIIKNPEATVLKWDDQITLFQQQLQVMKEDKKLLLKCTGIQIVRLTMYYCIPFFAAKALHLDISINAIGDIIAMSSFIHMLNALTPLPGDTGWSESAFVLVFTTMFTWNSASAIMLIWRFSTFHLVLILGAILFLFLNKQKKC